MLDAISSMVACDIESGRDVVTTCDDMVMQLGIASWETCKLQSEWMKQQEWKPSQHPNDHLIVVTSQMAFPLGYMCDVDGQQYVIQSFPFNTTVAESFHSSGIRQHVNIVPTLHVTRYDHIINQQHRWTLMGKVHP